MEVNLIFVMKIILLGLIHWMLVPLALQSLIERRKVVGGKKVTWALLIILLTAIGPLTYLVFHPQYQQVWERERY
jgi:hypothetical protein